MPRWQVYLNKRGIKELEEVLALTDELNLWNRVEDLGEAFNIHTTTFDSSGNGFASHHLRLTAGDEQFIPPLLWKVQGGISAMTVGFSRRLSWSLH